MLNKYCLLQLHVAISQQPCGGGAASLGLGAGSPLLCSLKQRVVALASGAGVLNTVQRAAQAVLKSGWSLLLPTPEERARALAGLLPRGGDAPSVPSAGHRFMTDLLVGSLMADGGLEAALATALARESRCAEGKVRRVVVGLKGGGVRQLE